MATRWPCSCGRFAPGIYTRISYDPAASEQASNASPSTVRPYAALGVGKLPATWRTTTAPPYSGKPRRSYQQLLRSVEAGEIDAIVTWHNDRLHRSPKQLEGFIDLLERTGVRWPR